MQGTNIGKKEEINNYGVYRWSGTRRKRKDGG